MNKKMNKDKFIDGFKAAQRERHTPVPSAECADSFSQIIGT